MFVTKWRFLSLPNDSSLYKHIFCRKVMPVSPTLSHFIVQQVLIEYPLFAWHCYNHYEHMTMKTEITAIKTFVCMSSLGMRQMRPEDCPNSPLLSEHKAEPEGGH